MKKIISILLVFVFLLSAVSCGHVHEFVYSDTESKPASCGVEGLEVKVCSCGEKEEKVLPALEHDMQLTLQVDPNCTNNGTIEYTCSHCEKKVTNESPALGHNMKVTMQVDPGCTRPGSIDYACSVCGKRQYESVDATGHAYEEAPSEPSRLVRCTNEGCLSCYWGEPNNKHKEALTFVFTKEDEAKIDAKYNEVLALLEAADKYDPALHAYAEEGALADAYAAVDAVHTELYELVEYAISQRQLAEVAYYCDMNNTELEETYSYMLDYHTAVVAKFYTLSRPFYDSCYRNFYYYGMTEEEINAYLFDSDAISNPEYTALKERNNAIEVEFLALANPDVGNELPMLYAEFVENNNKMAQLMGYDNYLEYAYENVYGRDYTYQDAQQLSEYAKTHLSDAFEAIFKKWDTLAGYTQEDIDQYYEYVKDAFFENLNSNTLVNDYIDTMAFTTNPEKNITFSDEFNKLMGDGNMFRGDYEGAFVTSIYSADLPIAYFGKGYDSSFTIVHEFGHFMNEIYTADIEDDEFNQSYDLLEMHSQGNELLFLCYLEDNGEMSEIAHTLVETYQLVNMFYIVMAGMTIDSFEQAVYLNQYNGTNADVIMADGKITYDEYDLLYEGICIDYGVKEQIGNYWRGGMTITSACYYVSYSVSAISVLQIYEMAHTQGVDVARDAYLKLFTYVDSNTNMSLDEILDYAGLLSFEDEQLYINLKNYMMK